MPGRGYTVTADAVSETTAQSLIRLTAPATAILIIDKVTVSQQTVIVSEMLAIQMHIASTAGTGAAITARPVEAGSTAFGGTALGTITADPTEGNIYHREPWNILAPFVWHPTPEERIVVEPSAIFVVHLDIAPAAATLFTTVIAFREIGA